MFIFRISLRSNQTKNDDSVRTEMCEADVGKHCCLLQASAPGVCTSKKEDEEEGRGEEEEEEDEEEEEKEERKKKKKK